MPIWCCTSDKAAENKREAIVPLADRPKSAEQKKSHDATSASTAPVVAGGQASSAAVTVAAIPSPTASSGTAIASTNTAPMSATATPASAASPAASSGVSSTKNIVVLNGTATAATTSSAAPTSSHASLPGAIEENQPATHRHKHTTVKLSQDMKSPEHKEVRIHHGDHAHHLPPVSSPHTPRTGAVVAAAKFFPQSSPSSTTGAVSRTHGGNTIPTLPISESLNGSMGPLSSGLASIAFPGSGTDRSVGPSGENKFVMKPNTMNNKDLMDLLPPKSHPEHFFRLNWLTHLTLNNGMVTTDFVAQMGRSVHMVDIRNSTELLGPLGYIPGVDWYPFEFIHQLPNEVDRDALVVLISNDDHDSLIGAHTLNECGMRFAAAMKGGMKSWKFMGYSTIRDDAILERCQKLRQKKDARHKMRLCGCQPEEPTICLTEIKHHIGDPLNIQWLKMAAFLVHGRQSCVDGRDDSGVIGTPGGDMGEFILALNILEGLCGKKFSYEEIETLMKRRFDAFGRFYMHTDVFALERLQAAMKKDERLRPVLEPLMHNTLDYRAFMRSPPKQYRAAIMEHQLNPLHIGCGHIRLLLQKAAEYRVRPKLVLHSLKAFWTARWNGSIEPEYMALSGEHREGAVINVHLAQKVASFTRIPLISPSCYGKQIFVNHPQISSFLRQQSTLFFTMQTDIIRLSEGAKDEFYPKVEALASHHLGVTLANLAAGLPVYETKFEEDFKGHHHFSCRKLDAAHTADDNDSDG